MSIGDFVDVEARGPHMNEQTLSPASRRFRELVHQRRALLPRKARAHPEVYAIASLRQVMEQLSREMAAGVEHDADEVRALVNLANEKVEAKQAQKARPKPKFRGLGR